MTRVITLLLLATISSYGQDSTFVKDFCNKLGQYSDSSDIDAQTSDIINMAMKYTERNPLAGDDLLQEGIRFQYRLDRELKRTCPNYPNGRVRLLPKLVYDLEDKLKKQQIDSLDILTALVNKDKGAYLYIVTIDEFFPESTITDFSNRYRDYWVPKTLPEKGAILIVVSVTQRQVRISTGDKSMTHLTDKECDEVIKVMIQHFKLDKYFDGLVDGVKAIKSKL